MSRTCILAATAAAVLLVATPVPSTAEEESPHLGMTRGEFFLKIRGEFPGLKLPPMPCGAPLVLKHCSVRLDSGLTISAAESYRHDGHHEAFLQGAEGLLYTASVVAPHRVASKPADFAEFFLTCTAFVWAAGLAPDYLTAAEVVTDALAAAAADLRDGYGEGVYRGDPATLGLGLYPGLSVECTVTAQWVDR